MSNHSIIEHRANYHFVKVEEDYIAICLKGKASPHCKALILAILEQWTITKRDAGEEPIIYMTYPQWIKATYWYHGRNVIIDSLQELEEAGFISRQPYRMYGKDTFAYVLNIEIVQKRIKELPEKAPGDNLPGFNLNAFKNKRVLNQTRPKSNGKGVYNQTPDAFNKGRNIDTNTQLPHIASEDTFVATSAEDCNAPTPINLQEEKKKRGDTDPRMKAMPKGQQNDGLLTTVPSSPSNPNASINPSDLPATDLGPHTATSELARQPGAREAKATEALGLVPEQQTVSLYPSGPLTRVSPVNGGKPGAGAKDKKVTQAKSDTREVQRRIDEHRGYALEERGQIVQERIAVKSWCNMHTIEDYEAVMLQLKTDPYWGKAENYHRIGGLTLAKETPKALAAPTPITTSNAPSNCIDHERNKRYSEELQRRFEEKGPTLKGLKLRHA